MSISTLQTIQSGPARKKGRSINLAIVIPAIIIATLLGIFGRQILGALTKIGGKSALNVDVNTGRAELFINGENIGVTPYESQEIKPGENTIKLRSSNRQYETTINFLANNDKYIHKVTVFRDLGVSDLFSAGQDLWFDEDSTETVLRIISEPSGASVFIDNTEIGKTPFTSSKLSEGDYDLRVERVGYEPQKARIRIQKGYTSNVSVKLFPMPVPSRVSLFEGSEDLYDISSDNAQVTSDTATWVKGAVYWNQTRGVNLEGIGLNKDLVFDYFIDYLGNLYDSLGNPLTEEENIEELSETNKGAYLGRISDGEGLTESARETYLNLKGKLIGDQEEMVKILPTGLGWLRVRGEPNTGGAEITKVDVGNEYVFLEETTGWIKIKISEEQEGWVSSAYAEKVEQEEIEAI